MQEENLPKTHSNRSIWLTLENTLDSYIKSFTENPMLLSRLPSQNLGQSIAELTLVVQTLRLLYGSPLTLMIIGLLSRNIIKQEKQSTTMQVPSTPINLTDELLKVSEIQAVHNGSKSSHNEESTLHRPIKKSEQTSTH